MNRQFLLTSIATAEAISDSAKTPRQALTWSAEGRDWREKAGKLTDEEETEVERLREETRVKLAEAAL
jgi:hypothetical protein